MAMKKRIADAGALLQRGVRMKSLVCSLLLFSSSAFAEMNLPILGKYELHQQLERGCFGMFHKSKFLISYSNGRKTFYLARAGEPEDGNSGFKPPSDPGETFFSTSKGFGIHRSEPSSIGYVHIETLTPFNEGRGLHASYVITLPGNNERNVVVDGTFEIEGDFLYANFKKTRRYGQTDAGKCILKRVQER
jgi:hypothetical protein